MALSFRSFQVLACILAIALVGPLAGCTLNPPPEQGTTDIPVDNTTDGTNGDVPAGQPTPTVGIVVPIAVQGQGTVAQLATAGLVTLTAIPADQWEFATWSGSAISRSNPLIIEATANSSLTATFREIQLPDNDRDGVPDVLDVCDGSDDNADADFDGVPDACDSCPNDPNNDADGDGLCGDVDNCPDVANLEQADSDDDNVGDLCDNCLNDPDNDIDGDGICGDVDICPTNADAAQTDTDGDGKGDACDPCPNDSPDDTDGDGVCDSVDACPGFDDTIDTDGDGIANGCENCPKDAANDADGDGLCEDIDNCPDVSNADQADEDGDNIGDVCDPCLGDPNNDGDKDGLCAGVDNCPNIANFSQADADADGIGNPCDTCLIDPNNDADGDGFCAEVDNCPNTANANQDDADNDGLGDACDDCPNDAANDADADRVCGDVDQCPNTPADVAVDTAGCILPNGASLPEAMFTFSPAAGLTGQAITFDASSSFDRPASGSITLYTWNFGDGSAVITNTEPMTTHKYRLSGDYTVSLAVSDNDSPPVTNSSTKIILITGPPTPTTWSSTQLMFPFIDFDLPESYDFLSDGILSTARFTVDLIASADFWGGSASIIDTDIPFGSSSDIYRVDNAFQTPGSILIVEITIDEFTLITVGFAARLDFEYTITAKSVSPSGQVLGSGDTIFVGKEFGTISNGGNTITWETIDGTVTSCNALTCTLEGQLDELFPFNIGVWTKTSGS